MGLFSAASPAEQEVAAATDGQSEDWAKIMAICDKAKESGANAKEYLDRILERSQHEDPHVVLHALTLLDACINNCGKDFHLQVASRGFETEFKKLLARSKGEVRSKMMHYLKNWAEGEFSRDSQLTLIPSLYSKVRDKSSAVPKTERASEQKGSEDADLARAIELSLKEVTSPKAKGTSSGTYSSAASTSSSVYPSLFSSSAPEGRKVRALYDFEAAEDGELTFKAGEIITVTDEADQNWWKGYNKRGDGLFPSNFVTSDLTVEQPRSESKRTVQFDEEVRVEKIVKEEVEINESKMDTLLHYLHDADPTDPRRDPPEMKDLADEVNAMGPLIDAELERVDGKHAQLSKLCMDLQGALNLYHSLMREPHMNAGPGAANFLPKLQQPGPVPGYPYPAHPSQVMPPGAYSSMQHQHHNMGPPLPSQTFIPDPNAANPPYGGMPIPVPNPYQGQPGVIRPGPSGQQPPLL